MLNHNFLMLAMVSYLDQVHDVNIPPSQHWYCTLRMFIQHVFTLSSNYLLMATTFERFYSIIRPHKAASFNTVKRAKAIIMSILLLCFTYSIPFLFMIEIIGGFCVINLFGSGNVLLELYHWLTEVLICIFPFVSLLLMNSVIIHTLRKRSKLKLLESGGQGYDQSEGHNLKHKHPEKQIFTMLLLVTFVFLALNIPTRSLVFYVNFYSGNTPYYYASLNLFYQISEKTYYTNHGINFFLYVMSGQKFRTDLRNLFVPKTVKKNEALASDTKISAISSCDN